jgi:hypothetical protein
MDNLHDRLSRDESLGLQNLSKQFPMCVRQHRP